MEELSRIRVWLSDMTEDVWRKEELEKHVRECCALEGIDFRSAAQSLRVALTGATASPPIFFVAEVLGVDETIGRIDDQLSAEDLAAIRAPLFPRPDPAAVKALLADLYPDGKTHDGTAVDELLHQTHDLLRKL